MPVAEEPVTRPATAPAPTAVAAAIGESTPPPPPHPPPPPARPPAAPAAEPGERRPGVADHGGAPGGVADPPLAGSGDEAAESGGQCPLGHVDDEDGRRGAIAELLLGVPPAGVAVADGAQVDVAAVADDHGGR